MNKKIFVVAGLAFSVAMVGATVQKASAFRFAQEKSPQYSEQRHELMQKAFANRDYEAWKVLTEGRGVARKINSDNFDKFAKAHELMYAGKTQEAMQMRQELGLGGQGRKMRDHSGCKFNDLAK